jgi:hypothetical protein
MHCGDTYPDFDVAHVCSKGDYAPKLESKAIKDNGMASIVGYCENCLYDIKVEIEKNGSADQKVALADSMEALERLYFLLQEEE